jgi:hypothetical protein
MDPSGTILDECASPSCPAHVIMPGQIADELWDPTLVGFRSREMWDLTLERVKGSD